MKDNEKEKEESRSIKRYEEFHLESAPPNYKNLDLLTRREQIVFSRLRMNHPYLWEVARDDPRYKTRCKLCHEEKKHTVNHYIYECIELENVREV